MRELPSAGEHVIPQILRFGVFELDTSSGELRRQGLKVRLPHQSFQVLLVLLERPGELVTRDVLRQRLWPEDTFVDFDAGIASAVRKLREALGDSAENPRFLETLPKRGYRFIASVESPVPPAHSAPAETPGARSREQRRGGLVLVGIAALGVALMAAFLFVDFGDARDSGPESGRPARIRSIAVLPLENLTGDPAQDELAAAITDSLTTELVRSRLIEVVSRTSATQFVGARTGLPEIARRLNVDAVVEGTLTRVDGNRWMFNVQLIDGGSDRHVWAQRYEGERSVIATLPGQVAWEILRAIPPELAHQPESGAPRIRPANEKAYAAYVQGRHLLGKRTPRDRAKAIEYFEQAIEADPSYAPAHAGLSDAWRLDTVMGIRDGNLQKAEAAARRALELDPNLAEAHTSLGGVLWRHWEWEEAERELRLALDLDPSSAEGHRVHGMLLLTERRFPEAVLALQRARELDPLSLPISVEYALGLTKMERFDDAVAELERARDLDPSFSRIYQGLCFVHAAQRNWAGAIAALEQSPARRDDGPQNPWLGYYYAVSGRRKEALDVLSSIESQSGGDQRTALYRGIVHLGLGNREQALDLLEQGIKETAVEPAFTAILFDYLSEDPRYHAILDDMGLRFPA